MQPFPDLFKDHSAAGEAIDRDADSVYVRVVLGPYIFISSLEKQMLSVGIKLFTEGTVTDPALQMSAATLVLMPVLVLFLFSQKYFVEGVNSSAVKG